MVVNGCSQRADCPNVVYPDLQAIDKIPAFYVQVNDGILDRNDTKKAFTLIKALRVSENYYNKLISQYREDFINEDYSEY